MKLVDSHCHLDLLADAEHGQHIPDVIDRAKANGVCYFLNVCVSIDDFPKNLQTAELYDCVGTTVGLHPNYHETELGEEGLIKLANHPKVLGIGETGLDYFRSEGNLDWQRERFRYHIRAANQIDKPLIIHTRDAKHDTLTIMREEQAHRARGVMHCFSEDWEIAKQALDMGFYISFSGIVTFKSAVTLQEVAKLVPMDRILIETDSPYLAPHPHRGKQNEPAFVTHTAECIAKLRDVSLEEVAQQTTENFFTLFKGAKQPHV